MNDNHEAIATVIEIAKDAQETKGCPNPGALRQWLPSYRWYKDAADELTKQELDDAIQTGFSLAKMGVE